MLHSGASERITPAHAVPFFKQVGQSLKLNPLPTARTGLNGIPLKTLPSWVVPQANARKVFRNPAFAGVSVVAFVLSAAMFSMFLYLTLYIQNGLGYTPFQTGLRFLPLTVMSFFCMASAPLPETFRPPVIGFIETTAFEGLMAA